MEKPIDVNAPYRLRPRFKVSVPLSGKEVMAKIQDKLTSPHESLQVRLMEAYVIIRIKRPHRRIWSPVFTMTAEDLPENRCLLRGVYSPAPGIWTLVVFLYVILGFSLFILLMWGFSLLSLGQDASVLWVALVILILMLAIWGLAQLGQHLSHKQMENIQDFLEEALDRPLRQI